MGNFAESFNALAGGLVGGYEAGQKAQLRSLQIDEAARGKRFTDKLSEGLGGQKDKGNWFQRLFNGYNEAWDRATGKQDVLKVRGDTTTTGGTDTATVTGGETYKTDTKREPNVEGGPSTAGIPPRAGATGVDFGPRSDQQDVSEGTSRSAFGYQPSTTSAPPVAGPEVQGSSGGVAPPGAGPSPQATAIADRAVRSVGGTPTRRPPSSTGGEQSVFGPGNSVVYPPGYDPGQPPGSNPNAGWLAKEGLIGPGQPTMVGREPPGGAPQGPAAPVSEPGRYPGDVGATARRTGGITLQNPTVQQQAPDQGSNVIPFKPVKPAGGIATPDDQKAQADVVRMANQPVPKGRQPDDLIKAIVPKDAPEGTLPTSQHLVDKLEAVMPELYKIDPERAVRLYGQTVEAMRIGMQHGLMRAQAAFEAGDANGAQRMLMIAYNKYVLNGTKAQFDVGKDGKSMTMQLFDEKTGKEMGKPTPVTQDMLAKMGVIATSPQAYAQYLKWQADSAETKRSHEASERLHGASIASAAADRKLAREQHAEEFKWRQQLEGDRFKLEKDRFERQDKRDIVKDKRDERTADRQDAMADAAITDKQRNERYRLAGEKGEGDWGPTPEDRRKIRSEVENLTDPTLNPPPKSTPKPEVDRLAAMAPQTASGAASLMQYNSGMSARDAVDTYRRMQRGEKFTQESVDTDGNFVRLDLGGKKFAVPKRMMQDFEQQPGGATPPPAAGGAPPTSTPPQGAAPPATTQGAIPTRGSTRGQLPSAPPEEGTLPAPTGVAGAREQQAQADSRAMLLRDKTRQREEQDVRTAGATARTEKQASQQLEQATARAVPMIDEVLKSGELQGLRGQYLQQALQAKVAEIAQRSGMTPDQVMKIFTVKMQRPGGR